jgi:hypothetical protein
MPRGLPSSAGIGATATVSATPESGPYRAPAMVAQAGHIATSPRLKRSSASVNVKLVTSGGE